MEGHPTISNKVILKNARPRGLKVGKSSNWGNAVHAVVLKVADEVEMRETRGWQIVWQNATFKTRGKN